MSKQHGRVDIGRGITLERRAYLLALAEHLIQWDVKHHVVLSGYLIVPFGKYEGLEVFDVPVTYLAETIVDMRPSVFVLLVRAIFTDPMFLSALANNNPKNATFLDILCCCFPNNVFDDFLTDLRNKHAEAK